MRRFIFTFGFLMGSLIAVSAQAQDEVVATLQKTTSPPTIDGVLDDAVWQDAGTNRYSSLDERSDGEPMLVTGEPLEDDDDLSFTWSAVWDDDNLYVGVTVTDDQLFIDGEQCNWDDDSIEVYIDAQNLDNEEYAPGNNPEQPSYQFTAMAAGSNEDHACFDWPETMPGRDLSSVFIQGINSYDGNELNHYPVGEDMSVSELVPGTDNQYTLEAKFPWSALEATPDEVKANGEMGFAIVVNDNDNDPADNRTSQVYWEAFSDDLWHVSASFPSVELSDDSVPKTPTLDTNGDGVVDVFDIDGLAQGDTETRDAILADFNADLGDVNADRSFDSGDLIETFATGNYANGEAAMYTQGDWNLDGFFDSDDLIEAFAQGSYDDGPPAATAAVPEPSSAMLMVLAALALVRRRR